MKLGEDILDHLTEDLLASRASIQSLGKAEYLGNTAQIRYIDGVVASAVSANTVRPGDNALHRHDNPIISFILEGDSVEQIGRHTNLRSAGAIRFYGSGDLHQVTIKAFPSRNINFEFESDFLTRFNYSEEKIKLAIENNSNAPLLFLRVYREFAADDALTETAVQIMLFQLLSEVVSPSKRVEPRWKTALHELLNDRWNEQLTLNQLSSAVNIHPVTISKNFTRYFGCSFGTYLRRLRINKSIAMVKTEDASLTDIALACGFADQSHFTRNFKELTGFLPKDFRKF